MNIIARKEALRLGQTTYYTGKPCSNGHLSPKYSTSGGCISCINDRSKIKDVSIDKILSLISYDPETGEVVWKERQGDQSFNTLRAGKPAGNIHRPIKSKTDYMRIRVMSVLYPMHRVAWAAHYGEWPTGSIDHIDGNGLNNRIENLRDVTSRENSINCRMSSNNTTGVNGVWRNAHGFVAEIMVNRKKISLGSYGTIGEARAARLAADKLYGFYHAHGSEK